VAKELDASAYQATQVIPVLGFATLKRFDLAEALLRSIDYSVEHLVIVDNSGTNSWQPIKPEKVNNLWMVRVPFGLGLVGAWNLIVKSLEIIAQDADPDGLCFPHITPDWSCIVLGQKVVEQVGLYDERFYPLYFDDNDYERRIRNAGLSVRRIEAIVHHQNSSTLKSGFQSQNSVSFRANQALLDTKIAENDYSEGNWSLKVRRSNSWD
jgi:hypothetical protein